MSGVKCRFADIYNSRILVSDPSSVQAVSAQIFREKNIRKGVRDEVFTFLRVRTWMRVDDLAAAKTMVEDAAMLGDLEGLAGHAAAARFRLR